MNDIVIYCDGGCRNNHLKDNIGGWAAILKYGNQTKNIYGSSKCTTNNKMELLACISALKLIKDFQKSVKVYTDSAYLHNCMTKGRYLKRQKNGWKNANGKPVENQNLWQEILNLIPKFSSIQFHKVQAHSGDKYNEMVDGLVNKAMDQVRV